LARIFESPPAYGMLPHRFEHVSSGVSATPRTRSMSSSTAASRSVTADVIDTDA
jgi:hypothetical protein